MIVAALYDRPKIVERLVVARADVNTKNSRIGGCALPLGPFRRRWSVGGRWRRRPRLAPAPSGRRTALHWAAYKGCTKAAVALLVGGADQTITDDYG